ncbi:membrane dipeptidase, partial [Acinetobacter calcoaceticus]
FEHLEYFRDHLGEVDVGFGSDFDGALIGTDLEDVTRLHCLIERMQQRGNSKTLIEKICLNNWVREFDRI